MGRLHCTEDPVPEAVGGDMQQLNQLGAQVGSAAGRGARGPGDSGSGAWGQGKFGGAPELGETRHSGVWWAFGLCEVGSRRG